MLLVLAVLVFRFLSQEQVNHVPVTGLPESGKQSGRSCTFMPQIVPRLPKPCLITHNIALPSKNLTLSVTQL